jgi:hypothetical protein
VSRFLYCYPECCSPDCHYAECHYAECRYADCHSYGCRSAIIRNLANWLERLDGDQRSGLIRKFKLPNFIILLINNEPLLAFAPLATDIPV